ncbi:MFS transporter [Streptomyces sp. NK08204]|uniref:MFS transporter n=1 Tax=Streptomyces sp. NK08204 TaxID=2873260 RepID=UPI001CEC5FC0|nr:MFS transporter [Streptomyces sp. NK08204]
MTADPAAAAARRARAAVTAVFFVHGAVFASWASRVPAVQAELRLSDGLLGLVLAGPGIGALVGSQAGGLLVRRLGSRAVSAMAPVALSVPLGLIPAARSAWILMGLLVFLGAADGCTSVAMNASAVVVQRRYGRAVLNSMHAVRSIGAVVGGLAGVAAAALGLALTTQFVLMATVLAVVSAAAAYGLGSQRQPAQHVQHVQHVQRTDRTGQAERTRTTGAGAGAGTGTGAGVQPADGRSCAMGGGGAAGRGADRRVIVLLLTLMTFLAAWVEDAPASWSGVYLRHVGADAATAAAGYAAFSAGSVLARLFNDWMVDRIGWARLIRVGALCCSAALAGALLLGQPGVTLAALVVAGAGISAVFPGAFTVAAGLPHAAQAMGHVGFAGNLGWLLVSPVIGGLATLVGLPTALGLLVVAAATIAGLAPITRSATPARSAARQTAHEVNS